MHAKTLLAPALLLATTAGWVASATLAPADPQVGEPAPEIDGARWYNHIGPPPSLSALQGQTVLLEFWATWCPPCVAAWPHLQELHDEFAEQGLVILALSSEGEHEKVESFVDQNGYTIRTASGSTAGSQKYGVTGIPHSVLIGPDGNILWRGNPAGLTSGRIKEALKGARKPPAGGWLAFRPTVSETRSLAPVFRSIEEGRLGKALSSAESLSQNASLSAEEQAAALALAGEIGAHADLLLTQADQALESMNLVLSMNVYETLSKELKGSEQGRRADQSLERIRKDSRLQEELKAAEALEKMKKSVARLSTSKKKKKYEEFAKSYAGTRAGEKAAAFARAN